MMGAIALAIAAGDALAGCDPSTQYTYTFTSSCSQPIWIGQRSTGDPASHPSLSGSWALSSACTTNADCPTNACDVDTGQCTCASANDCPGGAPCGADDKCLRTATFCMPQSWPSGTFWPRTGCTANGNQLACETGACFDSGGTPLLDCSVNNGGGSPTNPVTQFEVTSTSSSINYDVSIAAGYNVEVSATPVGGGQVVPGTPSTDVVECYDVGCENDLNATCPAALQVISNGAVIGCLDPCTRCQRDDPSPSLQCQTQLADAWTCGVNSGNVTNLDLYCAKNFVDGTAQASPNQGTPTAFSQLDCPPVTSFVVPTFTSYALPAGQGVCLYTSPPQSTTPGFNDFKWADAQNGASDCATLADGTACGGYRTTQSDGGYYTDALGYTCQTATFDDSGGTPLTAHLCMPPVANGLGVCQSDTTPGLPLYTSGAGVANQSWIDAGTLAGGGSPYYETFKAACGAAYAWQYDDIASGFSCTVASTVSGGSTFTGFDVTFCGSSGGPNPPPPPPPPMVPVVALTVHGRAAGLGKANHGKVRIKGTTTVPTSMALEELSVGVVNLLDQVGAAGELVASAEVGLSPRKRKKKVAIFQSDGTPRIKVVVHRPRPESENVKVIVIVKRATITKPACAGDATQIQTAVSLAAGSEQLRAGTVGPWRCKPKALKAE
jgi:hypothetical protein